MGPFKRYFEFVGGTSSKFWEVALAGNAVTVRFGRIGTADQSQKKVFADEVSAARAAARLVREKLGKGYVEKAVGPGRYPGTGGAASVATRAAPTTQRE
jgi:predicted DNA-binding WGR domain protein